ncbi:hypothetical protein [Cetobacterium sp. SF1]|uniref:hypothetical protein n=1 Tax=Cetobacterium sp. SF1 TaxID=3417654 RepID=UPI003CF8EA8D
MKKLFIILSLFLVVCINSFGEIQAKIYKNMTFHTINTRSTGRKIVGVGVLELTCNDDDLGSKIQLNFLKKAYMTNKKNWIEVSNLSTDEKDKSFILDRKTKLIKFYGVVDKSKIGKNTLDGDMIEGKYVGATPIMISIYDKEMKR